MFQLLKDAYAGWSADKASLMAAALAYYTLFAIAPLLVIVIELGALVIGHGHGAGYHWQIEQAILGGLQSTIGKAGAETIAQIIQSTVDHQGQGIISGAIGWFVLIFAAAGLFGALRDALNQVWEVPVNRDQSVLQMLRGRLMACAMIAAVALVLLLSLCCNAIAASFNGILGQYLHIPGLMQLGALAIAFGSATLLFALIFKYLPDVHVRWHDVWVGAAVTALLVGAGQALLALYFQKLGATSTYGAAGSLVAILLWAYYVGQILLFGAELTRAYSKRSAGPPNA